jgi:hypothetical protein
VLGDDCEVVKLLQENLRVYHMRDASCCSGQCNASLRQVTMAIGPARARCFDFVCPWQICDSVRGDAQLGVCCVFVICWSTRRHRVQCL